MNPEHIPLGFDLLHSEPNERLNKLAIGRGERMKAWHETHPDELREIVAASMKERCRATPDNSRFCGLARDHEGHCWFPEE